MKNILVLASAVSVMLVGISCAVSNPVSPVAPSSTNYTVRYEVSKTWVGHIGKIWYTDSTGASITNASINLSTPFAYEFTTTDPNFVLEVAVTNFNIYAGTHTTKIYINNVVKRTDTQTGMNPAICSGTIASMY